MLQFSRKWYYAIEMLFVYFIVQLKIGLNQSLLNLTALLYNVKLQITSHGYMLHLATFSKQAVDFVLDILHLHCFV